MKTAVQKKRWMIISESLFDFPTVLIDVISGYHQSHYILMLGRQNYDSAMGKNYCRALPLPWNEQDVWIDLPASEGFYTGSNCDRMVVYENFVYVHGQAGSEILDISKAFSGANDTWTKCATTGRHAFGMTLLNGTVYAHGGTSNGTSIESCDLTYLSKLYKALLPITPPVWSEKKNLFPTNLYGHCSISYKNQLYILGGVAGSPISQCSVVDLDAMKLNPIASMKMPRCHFCAICIPEQKIILAFGGISDKYEHSHKAEEYNIVTNTWTEIPNIPRMIQENSICTLDGIVYFAETGVIDLQYDSIKREWQKYKSPPSGFSSYFITTIAD